MANQPGKWDFAILLGILVLGTVSCFAFLLKLDPPSHFYQTEFAPAVMLSCGKGFRNPAQPPAREIIERFLLKQSAEFDCGALPEDGKTHSPNKFQETHRYLLTTLSLAWQLFGHSWESAKLIFALFFAASCAALYAVFRVFFDRIFSLLGVFIVATSNFHLVQIAHFRDYAKTPFMLALIFLTLLLVREGSKWNRVTISVLLGAVFGIGFGFRTDILLFLPLIALAILFFTQAAWNFEGLAERGLAAFSFAATATLLAFPILGSLSEGSNTFHVILLGLTPDFLEALDLNEGQSFLPFYNDSYLVHTLSAWVLPEFGAGATLVSSTEPYDRAGSQYWFALASYFPADFVTGALASVRKTLFLFYDRYSFLTSNSAAADLLRNIPDWIRFSIIVIPVFGYLLHQKYSFALSFFF